MTRLDLLDALTDKLKVEFLGCMLPNKEGVAQQINIYSQWLPQGKGVSFDKRETFGLKSYEADDYTANFPCIIVRLDDMTDSEENKLTASTVTVKIMTGVYDAAPDVQGYRDILNVQERIRALLLEHRIISGQFIMRMPLRSRLLDVETWPIWWGEQEMIYTLGRPLQDWEYVHGGHRPPSMRQRP